MTKRAPKKPAKKRTPKPLTTPRARPAYDKGAVDRILLAVSQGQSLRTAAAENNTDPGTFCGWVVDDLDGIAARYKRAQMIRAHILADECIEIADDRSKDFSLEEGRLVVDFDHINRARLRLDTRKWYLSKVLVKIYGDKLEVDAGPGLQQAITGARDALHGKLAGLAAAAASR